MQIPLLAMDGSRAELGTVRMHMGDWRDAWWSWPSSAALITDPPYGISYRSNWSVGADRSKPAAPELRSIARDVVGDETTEERDAALEQSWVVAAVWGPGRLDRIKPWGDPHSVLVHDKGVGVGMGDLGIPWKPNYETIAIYGKGWAGKRTSSVLRGSVVSFGESASNGRRHPNQKPLTICAELVGKAPAGSPIVDPFAGSGQVLLAATLLGVDAFGAEIDPEHYSSTVAVLRAHGITVLEGPELEKAPETILGSLGASHADQPTDR